MVVLERVMVTERGRMVVRGMGARRGRRRRTGKEEGKYRESEKVFFMSSFQGRSKKKGRRAVDPDPARIGCQGGPKTNTRFSFCPPLPSSSLLLSPSLYLQYRAMGR